MGATIVYSPYLEKAHHRMLDHEGSDLPFLSVLDAFNAAVDQSPYTNWTPVALSDLFFGPGKTLYYYDSVFSVFKRFMEDVDTEALWNTIVNNSINSSVVNDLVDAHSAYLQDELDSNTLPQIAAGLRDINSVVSSVFVAAKAIVQDSKVKAVSKFSAEVKFKLLEIAKERWNSTLTWNKQVVAMYGEYVKLYVSAKMDTDTLEMDFRTKDKLWNIKLFEYTRAMLGAIQGTATTPGLSEPSQAMKSISGAMSGAALGASIGGNGYGAAVGGVLGLAASFIK